MTRDTLITKTKQFRSQCGEDRWLAKHWDRLGLPDVGFYVEVGAADGFTFSNTWWLAQRGWHGLLIEPDPRHVIVPRENCEVVPCAIGPTGVVSLGLDPDPFLSGIKRESESRIDVPSRPLSEVLDYFTVNRVDFLSIDTEGTELEAWRTLDLTQWRPRVVIMELVSWGISDRTQEITDAMRGDGYERIKLTAYNGIFKDAQQP